MNRTFCRRGRARLATALIVISAALFAVPVLQAQNPNICYLSADDANGTSGEDVLTRFDLLSGTETTVGLTGTNNLETIAYRASDQTLFGSVADRLGVLSQTTGTFVPRPSTYGTGDGAEGSITFDDVDGVTHSTDDGVLYGVHLRPFVGDALFQIDPATGLHIPDAFGPGVDYVIFDLLPGFPSLTNMDDITIDPGTGQMYGILNDGPGGGNDRLVAIDDTDGSLQDLGATNISDLEGLTINTTGQLLATSGKDSANVSNRNQLWDINKTNGDATNPRALIHNDYEGVACLTAPVANLSVTKTAAPDPVMQGGTLTYTVTVTNNGTGDATGVTLTDELPPAVTYVSATPSQGTCSESGGTVTCDLGDLADGESATVTIEVTAPNMDTTITNTASASADQPDPEPDNDSDTETTTVGLPGSNVDLSITKTDDPDPVPVGAQLTYTLTVTNGGPDSATGVTVVDTLPASVTYVSAMPSQGDCTRMGQTVTCSLGGLAPSASATITLVVRPQSAGTIVNDATVSANETELDTSNNSASETTTVVAAAVDLVLFKSDSPDPVEVGDILTYTIDIANNGPSDATDVVVTDTLPASVDFVSASATQGSCEEDAGVVTCTLGNLADGSAATVTIQVRPTVAGTINNSAQVSAGETDSDTSNNSDSESTAVEASPSVPEIPTLSEIGLLLMVLLLATGAMFILRRRSA